MKRITLLLLLFWMLLPCSQAMSVSLSFEPASQTAILGDEINLLLNISGLNEGGPDSLGAFSLGVTYDPKILAFSSVAFGNYLGEPSLLLEEADTFFENDPLLGFLYLDEVSWLSENDLGQLQPTSFSLATLTFVGIGLGTADVLLNLDFVVLSDATGLVELSLDSFDSASVTVAAPVPEPATILLLAVGMSGLGLVRRRRLMSR